MWSLLARDVYLQMVFISGLTVFLLNTGTRPRWKLGSIWYSHQHLSPQSASFTHNFQTLCLETVEHLVLGIGLWQLSYCCGAGVRSPSVKLLSLENCRR